MGNSILRYFHFYIEKKDWYKKENKQEKSLWKKFQKTTIAIANLCLIIGQKMRK